MDTGSLLQLVEDGNLNLRTGLRTRHWAPLTSRLFDNAGKFSEYVHEETIKSVCEAFPRNGWSEAFACAVEKEMAYVLSCFSASPLPSQYTIGTLRTGDHG